MKKILLILVSLQLTSCDPGSCTEEILSNQSDKDLVINLISSNSSYNEQIYLNRNSSSTVGNILCSKGGVVVNYSVYDYIYI